MKRFYCKTKEASRLWLAIMGLMTFLSLNAVAADLVENLSQYPADSADSHTSFPRVSGVVEIPIRASCPSGSLRANTVQSDKSSWYKTENYLAVDPVDPQLYTVKVDTNKLLNGWVGIILSCRSSYYSTTLRVSKSAQQIGSNPFSIAPTNP